MGLLKRFLEGLMGSTTEIGSVRGIIARGNYTGMLSIDES